MGIDVKAVAKIRNRFDFVVEDVKTGEVVQRAKAENTVLNNMVTFLQSTASGQYGVNIIYGTGTGTLDKTRTTLFARLGSILASGLTATYNVPPVESFSTRNIVIPPDTHTGQTLTEVGLSYWDNSTSIVTHALLEDSEGNPISIGPLTDTQQVTIYSTVYATYTTADAGVLPVIPSNGNRLIGAMLGVSAPNQINTNATRRLYASSDKTATDQTTNYMSSLSGLGYEDINTWFGNHDLGTKTSQTSRIRFGAAKANGRVWSMYLGQYNASVASRMTLLRILFPNALYSGHQFVGKAIGTGDGVTTEFSLPWSDINEIKAKTWYINGVATAATVTENTTTSTKIQFASAPANSAPITGDWWVDYIPKDSVHVIDVTFTVVYDIGT